MKMKYWKRKRYYLILRLWVIVASFWHRGVASSQNRNSISPSHAAKVSSPWDCPRSSRKRKRKTNSTSSTSPNCHSSRTAMNLTNASTAIQTPILTQTHVQYIISREPRAECIQTLSPRTHHRERGIINQVRKIKARQIDVSYVPFRITS